MKYLLSGSSGSKQTKFLLTENKERKKNVEGGGLFCAERFG
jgi:hypothetical protein